MKRADLCDHTIPARHDICAFVAVHQSCPHVSDSAVLEVRMRTRSKAGKPAVSELPAWHGLRGVRRIQAELKYLTNKINDGDWPQVKNLSVVGDDITKWRFELKDFDNNLEGGRDLNMDLNILHAMKGQDHIKMEITFPSDYPNKPFFLRVISPRMCWYTGHVTAGGSICIEALTESGTAGSWTSQYNVESIMNIVICNMIDCEVYWVQTMTGPGGMAGPLRVDLEGKFGRSVLQQYGSSEAQQAFDRTAANHRRTGWGLPGR